MDVSASGMDAAQSLFDVAAENIANYATPGYQQQEASLVSTAGGVAVGGVGVPAGAGPADPRFSNVDLATQMAQLVLASGMYAANARAFAVENRMYGSLLDVLA